RPELRPAVAVAVLSGQRSAVGHDEVRGVLHEGPVGTDAAGGAEVVVDPAVHAALAPVSEEDAVVAVPVEQAEEIPQVVAEPLRRYGGVLPVRPAGVPVETDRHAGGAGGVPAHLPDGRLVLVLFV